MEDDVVAANFRVELRDHLQPFDARFHEERHEPQFDLVFRLKLRLVLLAKRHHSRHVDFIESG